MRMTNEPDKKEASMAFPTPRWIFSPFPSPKETESHAAAPSPKNRESPHPTTVIGKMTPVAALPKYPTLLLPTKIWSTML